jgi:hypothetical protein
VRGVKLGLQYRSRADGKNVTPKWWWCLYDHDERV